MDTGPHRDIVGTLSLPETKPLVCISIFSGDLAQAIRNTSVHFGVYFSQFEWYNPLFLQDQANDFKTQIYPKVNHTVVMYMATLYFNYYRKLVSLSFMSW